MCLYPRLLENKKYKINKKNGGNVPAINDLRVKHVPVPCGNCIECRKQKAREWQLRLLEDVKTHKNGHMVTLTFNTEELLKLTSETKEKYKTIQGYELDNEIARLAIRRFTERWRKEYKTAPRHWLITELGHTNTEHLHIHGIIWTDENGTKIQEHWKYGNVWAGYKGIRTYVNSRTVNYLIKYVTKQDLDHPNYRPKIFVSKGIGLRYITENRASKKNEYNEKETKQYYRTDTGHKIAMPTYWRNKIYTEEEREKLWLKLLDKNERWVLGQRIDISNGEEEYYKALEWAQAKNKRLGYGSDKINWKKKQYENERRKLKQEERFKKSIYGAEVTGTQAKAIIRKKRHP